MNEAFKEIVLNDYIIYSIIPQSKIDFLKDSPNKKKDIKNKNDIKNLITISYLNYVSIINILKIQKNYIKYMKEQLQKH